MIKTQKSRIAGNFLNLIKNIYEKTNIIFNARGLKAFPLRSGPR